MMVRTMLMAAAMLTPPMAEAQTAKPPPVANDDDLLAPLVPAKPPVRDCRQVMDETNVFTTDDGIELAPLVTVAGRGKKVRPPADDSDLLTPLVRPSEAERAACKQRLDAEIARKIARKIRKRKGTPMQVVGVEIRTFDPCFWRSLKNRGKDCESREMVRHEGIIITDRSGDGPEPEEPPVPPKRPPIRVGGRPAPLPTPNPVKPGGAPGQVAGAPPNASRPPIKTGNSPGVPAGGTGQDGAIAVTQPAPEPVW